MNEQLQAKLVEILSGIQAAVKAAGDFALEQLPDIAYQYISYGRALSLVVMIITVLLFVIGLWLCIKKAIYGTQKDQYYNYGWSDNRSAALVGGGALLFVSCIIFTINLSNTMMVWFAPKVWLIKELAVLIK